VNTSIGAVVEQVDYDEFGVVLSDTNPGLIPFGFAGGMYDKDTGLVRFGARDYDASVGRWTTKDPIGFGGGSLTLYDYALNDPVNSHDATGRNPAAIAFAACLADPPCAAALAALAAGAAYYGALAASQIWNWANSVIDHPGWKPPFTGDPGSTVRGWKQTRRYGPDGLPQTDVDTGHDHDQGDPHAHDWDRGPGGTCDDSNRGPGRSLGPDDPPPPPGAPPSTP
jgi:RHS repeat-associated protein